MVRHCDHFIPAASVKGAIELVIEAPTGGNHMTRMFDQIVTVVCFFLAYYAIHHLFDPERALFTAVFSSFWFAICVFHARHTSIFAKLKERKLDLIFAFCGTIPLWTVEEHPVIKILLMVTVILFFLACFQTATQIAKWFRS